MGQLGVRNYLEHDEEGLSYVLQEFQRKGYPIQDKIGLQKTFGTIILMFLWTEKELYY